MKKHPTEPRLEGFYLSQSEEDREILTHLMLCPRCRARLGEIAERHDTSARPEPEGAARRPAFGSAPSGFAFALTAERLEAPELFVDLTGQPPERWGALIAAEKRFLTWGFLELVIERSLEVATRNPELAEHLGRLALQVAERLDLRLYGAGPIEDLRARAWAHIGNARRVRSDLAGAEEAFTAAFLQLGRGTADPLEKAVLFDLKASLRRDQRRFDEAASLLRKAIRIFQEMDLLRQSFGLIEAEREPRLREYLRRAEHNPDLRLEAFLP